MSILKCRFYVCLSGLKKFKGMRQEWNARKNMFNQKVYHKLWEVSNDIDDMYDNSDFDMDPMEKDLDMEDESANQVLDRKSPVLAEWFESLTDKTVNNQSRSHQKIIKTDKMDNSKDKMHNDEVYINPLSGSPIKKNGTVYEDRSDYENDNLETNSPKDNIDNIGQPKRKPKTKQAANEEKRLRNYYLTQMEDLSNCHMVNFTSDSITPKYLTHHFGDAYKEGLCLPRKFFISLEGRNNNRKESCRVLFEVVGMANALESMEDSNYVSIQKLRYLV